VSLHLFARSKRQELDGPDDDLAEISDARPASAGISALPLRCIGCLLPTHPVPRKALNAPSIHCGPAKPERVGRHGCMRGAC
jgi:hypothetical protein